MNILAAPSYLSGLFVYGPYAVALRPKVVIMHVVTVSHSCRGGGGIIHRHCCRPSPCSGGEPSYLAGLFVYGPYAVALRPKVGVMPVVAIVPVVTMVAALFPIVAVGPVVAVAVALFPGVVDAEAVANRICTTHIVAAL
jgi:hypothetical protein